MFVLEYRYDGAKRTTFGSHFGTMRSRQGSNCHVATSPRRDVTKSRRLVNKRRSQQITTSRRHHVATSPRRDVSSKICISSLNARRLGNLGHRGVCDGRHEISEPATQTSRNFLDFCIVFLIVFITLDHMMMFFTLYILFLSFMMF